MDGYVFGPFRLELPAVLYRGAERVPAPPKVLDLLRLLLAVPGQLVSREHLQDALWPDVVVEENNLAKVVFLLRQTLGAEPGWDAAVETIPKRGYRFVRPVQPLARSAARTIAVLPCSDPEPADQYLAEGIAEQVLNRLMKAPGLSVLARASSFHFGMGTHDLPAIARALGVDFLVDGRLERTGDGFRVTAHLFDARRATTIWSTALERRAAEVLLLDATLASGIAHALGHALPASAHRPSPPQALESVAQARYFWNRRPGEVVNRAIRCYQDALALDPECSEAWAGLAEVYVTLGSWEAGVLPHAEGQSKAMAHASRALAIDPTLPEAHAALGYAALHYGWDLAAAETSFRSALTLGPQCVTAHHWYSHCLAAAGRVEESLEASQRCLQLDPMNLLMHVHLAWHHHMARQPAEVVAQSERVVAMDPTYHWGHYFLAWGLEGLGDPTRALVAAREGQRVAQGNPVMTALVGRAHAVVGEREPAIQVITELERAGGTSANFAYEIALVHLGLGDRAAALDWLERACQQRSGWLGYLGVDPRLDPLRAEARFQAVEAAVGLRANMPPTDGSPPTARPSGAR